jgi:hypothetical protein
LGSHEGAQPVNARWTVTPTLAGTTPVTAT